jgi:hypothetical protein
MSFIDNLQYIRCHGEMSFLRKIRKDHQCLQCKELKSIHSKKCFRCETIHSWKD